MITFLLILLIILSLLLSKSSSKSSSSSLLVLFRPRSRHTSTLQCDIYHHDDDHHHGHDNSINDATDWTIPHIELINLYNTCGGRGHISINSYISDDDDDNELKVFSQFKRVNIYSNSNSYELRYLYVYWLAL